MKEILNNNDIRANNARKILFVLRNSEPCTKKDIAEQLNLSLPTITNITKILSADGLIEECGNVESSVGRKPALITLKTDAKYGIGVHVDTFNVAIGIVDFAGKIIFQNQYPVRYSGTEEYWKGISALVEEAVDETAIPRENIAGVDIAAAPVLFPEYWGVLKVEGHSEGTIKRNNVHSYFPYPCNVITVAVAAGIPRLCIKAIENDIIVIQLSRYIDACILQNKDGYAQPRTFSVGHISLNFDGKQCYCGKKGCFQTYCSTSNLIDQVNGIDTSGEIIPSSDIKPKIHWREFVKQADEGNEEYAALFDNYLNKLAYAIHNLYISFGADTDIVICGDITEIIAEHKDKLVEKIDSLSPMGKSASEYVHTSGLKRYQACIGAAMNTFENVFSNL